MLNILPKDKKLQLEQESVYRLIRVSAIIICLTFIGLDIIFILSRYGLNWWEKESQQPLNASVISEEEEHIITSQLDLLQETVSDIQSLGPKQNPLPITLLPLHTLPDGITIESTNTDFLTGEVSIKGIADTRDALLSLQDLYRSYPEYESINFPVTNLTARDHIPFVAEAIVTSEYMVTSAQ